MNTVRPPQIATWLLNHFGSSPNNDVIIGDLAERYQLGRSRWWYRRQVLVAILSGFSNECRENKLLMARAFLIGLTLLSFFPVSFNFLFRDVLFALESWSRWWRAAWILPLTWCLYAALFCTIGGWLIARLHRPHQISMVLVFALSSCLFVWPAAFSVIAAGTRWWPTYVMPILFPVSILFGGGLLHRRDPSTIGKLN